LILELYLIINFNSNYFCNYSYFKRYFI